MDFTSIPLTTRISLQWTTVVQKQYVKNKICRISVFCLDRCAETEWVLYLYTELRTQSVTPCVMFVRNTVTLDFFFKTTSFEDANCLYLYCMSLPMPGGIPVHWETETEGTLKKVRLTPKWISKGETEFVLYTASQLGHNDCQSYWHPSGQARLGGKRKFRYDLIHHKSKTAYSFAGCYW